MSLIRTHDAAAPAQPEGSLGLPNTVRIEGGVALRRVKLYLRGKTKRLSARTAHMRLGLEGSWGSRAEPRATP